MSVLTASGEREIELRFRVPARELAATIRADGDGLIQSMSHPEYAEHAECLEEGQRLLALVPRLEAVGDARVDVVIRFAPDELVEFCDAVASYPADLRAMALSQNLVEGPEHVLAFARRLNEWNRSRDLAEASVEQVG